MTAQRIDRLEIEGYKSIARCDLRLDALNVLVGPNGAGKSNLISAFGLLREIVNQNLQVTVARAGGASGVLHRGVKFSRSIRLGVRFGPFEYKVFLGSDTGDNLFVEHERLAETGVDGERWVAAERAKDESGLRTATVDGSQSARVDDCIDFMSSWHVFHFHDTSAQAGVKQKQSVDDNDALRPDASNLAPFLFRLQETSRKHYDRIVDSIRLVAPFFRDFRLRRDRLNSDRIALEWEQIGTDAYLNAAALSDGTLRFIGLSTLLLQPDPPAVIVIDEPELGLHPFAIAQLADMFRSVAKRHQLIVSTQSVTLLNNLDPENIVVTEQRDGESLFARLDVDALRDWLRDYAVGDLWEKNVLGGRPY